MTRNEKILPWLLSGFGVLAVIAIASFVVRRVDLTNEVNTRLAKIHAAGVPTNGKELNAYYPAVPDSENAALVMMEAFALMKDFSDSRSNELTNFKVTSRRQSLTIEQQRLLSDYVEMNSAALTKMREAVKLPQSRYPVDYTLGPATPLPHLGKLKKLATIARYKSLLAIKANDKPNAVVEIENILAMAHTLENEPDIIAQLVRISLLAIDENLLEHCLNSTNLNEVELAGLASTFSSVEKSNLMARALAGELAINVPVFRQANRNAHDAMELVKGAKDAGQTFSTSTLDAWLIRTPRLFQLTGFWDRDLLYYLNVMETNIALDSFAPPRSLTAADNFKKAGKEIEKNHFYLSKLFLEALSNTVIKEANGFAYLRTSIAAIAVERFRVAHGQLPENLNEVVPQFISVVPIDPFDGQPLRYRRLEKGYVIYCIGSDGQDNGGREKPADWKSGDKTTYDITFTVERSSAKFSP